MPLLPSLQVSSSSFVLPPHLATAACDETDHEDDDHDRPPFHLGSWMLQEEIRIPSPNVYANKSLLLPAEPRSVYQVSAVKKR